MKGPFPKPPRHPDPLIQKWFQDIHDWLSGSFNSPEDVELLTMSIMTSQPEAATTIIKNVDNDGQLLSAYSTGIDEEGMRDRIESDLEVLHIGSGALDVGSSTGQFPITFNDINSHLAPKTTGAGKPTLATFSGNIKYFTMAIGDISELDSQELLHNWKEGTPIDIHIHWISNGSDGSDRYVKWEMDYSWADVTGVFPVAATVSAETTIPSGTTSKTHFKTAIVSITPTGKIGAHLLWSLKRIAASSTAPTSDPFVLGVGIHYQINTLGSRTSTAK